MFISHYQIEHSPLDLFTFSKHNEMNKLLLKVKTYLTGVYEIFCIFILIFFSYNQVDLGIIWCFNKYKIL